MRRVIAILLENEAGALCRVTGLFAQRNYNIETLNVAPTEDKTLSRVTISTYCNHHQIEQILKHLNRLVEVCKVVDLSQGPFIERELILIKVSVLNSDDAANIKRLADIFHATIVDMTRKSYTLQMLGTTEKLDAFIELIGTSKAIEVVRTGVSGIARGSSALL